MADQDKKDVPEREHRSASDVLHDIIDALDLNPGHRAELHEDVDYKEPAKAPAAPEHQSSGVPSPNWQLNGQVSPVQPTQGA